MWVRSQVIAVFKSSVSATGASGGAKAVTVVGQRERQKKTGEPLPTLTDVKAPAACAVWAPKTAPACCRQNRVFVRDLSVAGQYVCCRYCFIRARFVL